MWSYASLIGCNLRRLKAPLKGTSSHATHLAVYVNMIHAPREHDEKNGSPRIWGSALGQHSTTSRHNFSVLTSAPVMNVDHGGGTGGQVPPKFGAKDANANRPVPQILSYRYKNECSVAFKIRHNPFSAGNGPRWGSSRRFPDSLVGWRGDTPSHTPPHSAQIHRRSPCVPPEVQPDLRL